MLLATAAVVVFALKDHGIAVIGDIPAGLPIPQVPDASMSDMRALLLPAVGVAIVAYSDNVLTARAFATRNHYTVDANQELLALGVGEPGRERARGASR